MQQAINDNQFMEIARRWGYRGTVSVLADGSDMAPFVGTVRDCRLSSGFQVCTAEMLSLRASVRTGTVDRSIMLICSVSGDPVSYALDNGRSFSVEPGTLAFLTASDALSLVTSTQRGEQSGLLVVQADPSAIMDADLATELDRRVRCTDIITGLAAQRTLAFAGSLFGGIRTSLADKLIAESCALEIFAQLIEGEAWRGEKSVRGDQAKIRRVCEYLEANLAKEHHLPLLAREAGMSLSSFKTKFHEVTGQTVFGYLTEKRLERARFGIEQEGWSIIEAAWFSGYRHPTNFSAAFRRHFGFSPKMSKRH